jgi:hypothetical protein
MCGFSSMIGNNVPVVVQNPVSTAASGKCIIEHDPI